jgi:parallel beta-helix repeat protein
MPTRRRVSPWPFLLPAAAFSLLALAHAASAAQLDVPGDAATIQAAIDLAAGGDVVEIANGIWTGPGNRDVVVAKSIVIRSASGDPDLCVVDCQGAGRGFVFQGLASAARLESITITNGSAPLGGGILITGVSPTLENCRVLGNEATGTGGGGIALESSASPRLVGCMISGNVVSGINGGAGIWNVGGSPTLINCILVGNTTSGAGIVGGAMYTTQGGVPVLANCALYGNSAYEGSGLYCSFTSNPDIVNSIVWGNDPGTSGLEIVVKFSAVASASYCDIEGGFTGTGNLDANPIFVDADGPDDVLGTADDDLSLGRFSPCTDAGNNAAAALAGVTEDQAGQPRFANDLGIPDTGNGANPVVDIGPFERQLESVPFEFRVPSEVATIQAAVAAAGPGDEVLLADGTHSGPGNFDILCDRNVVIRSESGDPSACVIDCQGAGRAFSFVGVGTSTRLEGVTLKNGQATEGGALYLSAASPSLTNCRIVSNTATGAGGGGLYCDYESSPTLTNCVIRDNLASGTYGGGLYNKRSSSPVLTNCVFAGNTTTGVGTTGGAIYNWTSNPSLTNCSIGGNSSYDAPAMYSAFESFPELLNCVVWGNVSTVAGGTPLLDKFSSITYVGYCDIEGGAPGPANLQQDPLFLDSELRVPSWSPCVDAGNNTYVTTLTDLDGGPRIWDGDDDSIAVVDMGAHEFSVDSPTSVLSGPSIASTTLMAPRPNPSRTSSQLAFQILRAGAVSLSVFDVAGRRVRTLAEGVRPAGSHVVTWDGTNDAGIPVAAGAYIVRLATDHTAVSRKIHRVR